MTWFDSRIVEGTDKIMAWQGLQRGILQAARERWDHPKQMRELRSDEWHVHQQHNSNRLLVVHEQANEQLVLPDAESRGFQRCHQQLPVVSGFCVICRI